MIEIPKYKFTNIEVLLSNSSRFNSKKNKNRRNSHLFHKKEKIKNILDLFKIPK